MLNSKLNSEQEKIVQYSLDAKIIVRAGPGSGKTTVMVNRIVRWMQDRPNDDFLVLSHTNQTLENIKDKLFDLLTKSKIPQPLNLQKFFKTFHLFAGEDSRKYKSKCKKKYEIKLIANDDFNLMTNNACSSMFQRKINKKWGSNKVRHDIIKEIWSMVKLLQLECYREDLSILTTEEKEVLKTKWIKQKIQANKDFLEAGVEAPLIKKMFEEKTNFLDDDSLIDQSETLTYYRDFLQNNKDKAKEIANKYKCIFVDEFQDINIIQLEMISILADSSSNKMSLFCVGDPNQAIFGFSGGTTLVFKWFEEKFSDAQNLNLCQNYRSTGAIVQLSTQFINNYSKHEKINALTENKQGAKIVFCETQNNKKEASLLIELSKKSIEQKKDLKILFLCRNKQHSKVLQTELTNNSIDFLNYHNSPNTKDVDLNAILSGEKYYDGFKKNDPFYQEHIEDFYNFPKKGLGPVSWKKIFDLCKEEKFPGSKKEWLKKALEHQNIETNIKTGIQKLLEQIKQIEDLEKTSSLNLCEKLWIIMFEKSTDSDSENEKTFEKLTKLQKYFDWNKKKKNTKISISTIHKYKGGEADVVFLISLVEERLPYKSALNDELSLSEEANLVYVAITRAKKHLYLSTFCELSWSKNRKMDTSRYYKTLKKICINEEIWEFVGDEFVSIDIKTE